MTAERFRELVEVGQKVAVITSQYGCENSDQVSNEGDLHDQLGTDLLDKRFHQ